MTSRPPKAKLTQQEVQDGVLALIRIATVWARRSFEQDEPRDRPDDERLLGKVIALVRKQRDVPLVTATGNTKTLLRASSMREFELFQAVHDTLTAAKAAGDDEHRIAARLRLAFRYAGAPCSSADARRYAGNLMMERPPTELAGRVLQMFGLRGYRSAKAIEGSIARAREVASRREASRRELIEYFIACLQVPEEDLHAIAAAVDSVSNGGTLTATPRRWDRRSSLGPAPKHPSERPKYARYGSALLSDASVGILSDEYQPEDQDFE